VRLRRSYSNRRGEISSVATSKLKRSIKSMNRSGSKPVGRAFLYGFAALSLFVLGSTFGVVAYAAAPPDPQPTPVVSGSKTRPSTFAPAKPGSTVGKKPANRDDHRKQEK
jgi:hypothetical protein